MTGGLARSAIHEWFGDGGERAPFPPLTILSHLAHQALLAEGSGAIAAVWVGALCRPYPPLLARMGLRAGASLLQRSVFIDARNHAERVWAIELALRCPAVAVVVGDGAGLSMAESRRLQLAAAAGGALGLVVKPPREIGALSAAHTRWLVRSDPSPTGDPGWAVELLRCKGMRPLPEDARRLAVRWRHETGDVGVVPDALDRPAQETRQVRIRRAV